MPNLGDHVSFRLCDVYLPAPREVLATLTEEAEVAGTVVDFSDSGQQTGVFAVIELAGREKVVVPVNKLQSMSPAPVPDSKVH